MPKEKSKSITSWNEAVIDAHNRRKKIFRYNDDEYERITIFSYRKRDKENEKDDKIIFDYKQPIALGIRRKFSFRTIIKILLGILLLYLLYRLLVRLSKRQEKKKRLEN